MSATDMLRSTHAFEVAPAHQFELSGLGLDTLERCLTFAAGETVKAQIPGRDVLRVARNAGWYYVKRIRGKGWRELLHESRLLRQLRQAGLPVPEPVATGAARGTATLVTVGLPTAATLESVLLGDALPERRLRILIERVATVLRDLHACGINHRDFYAGHIHLDDADNVYLVDFGRGEMRPQVPRRRIIKDLAALHFSIPMRVLGTGPRLRFLRIYLGNTATTRQARRLAGLIERKSQRMRQHSRNKLERGEPNVHLNE